MPRKARKDIQSKYVHLMIQGLKREKIFTNNEYKMQYLKYINNTIEEGDDVRLLAYCIMDNHAHFLIYVNDINNLSESMKRINTKYAMYYNKKERRVGYVFRNRYHTRQISDRKQLYNTIVYIHRNPVKSGIVEDMGDYKYSSYKKFIKRKVDLRTIQLLFDTIDYMNIFKYIHKNFDEYELNKIYDIQEGNVENKEEKLHNIILDFCKEQNIQLLFLQKDNNLILELLNKIQKEANIPEKLIASTIGIGKNRITQIKKKLKA